MSTQRSRIWGAHAPSHANFAALAEILVAKQLARTPIAAPEARAIPRIAALGGQSFLS
jgi:hypothetical protein